MTDMDVNIDLMVATMTHIDENPDEWNQFFYAYRGPVHTTFCFAGRALDLSGYLPRFVGANSTQVFQKASGGPLVRADEAAQDILGLDAADAESLFWGGNTLDCLREQVSDLTGGAYRC